LNTRRWLSPAGGASPRRSASSRRRRSDNGSRTREARVSTVGGVQVRPSLPSSESVTLLTSDTLCASPCNPGTRKSAKRRGRAKRGASSSSSRTTTPATTPAITAATRTRYAPRYQTSLRRCPRLHHRRRWANQQGTAHGATEAPARTWSPAGMPTPPSPRLPPGSGGGIGSGTPSAPLLALLAPRHPAQHSRQRQVDCYGGCCWHPHPCCCGAALRPPQSRRGCWQHCRGVKSREMRASPTSRRLGTHARRHAGVRAVALGCQPEQVDHGAPRARPAAVLAPRPCVLHPDWQRRRCLCCASCGCSPSRRPCRCHAEPWRGGVLWALVAAAAAAAAAAAGVVRPEAPRRGSHVPVPHAPGCCCCRGHGWGAGRVAVGESGDRVHRLRRG